MSTPDDYLERLIDRLTDECLHGLVHYQYWRLLNDMARDESELAEAAPAFFLSTAHAHIDSATLRLYRLIDKTKKAVSVYTLLKFAERNPGAFRKGKPEDVAHAISSGRKLLEDVEDVLERFREQRNGYFIHISGEYFSQPQRSVTKEHPLTYKDIHESLMRIGQLLNIFRSPHDDSQMLMEVSGIEEAFLSLKLYLKIGLQYEEEDFRKRWHTV